MTDALAIPLTFLTTWATYDLLLRPAFGKAGRLLARRVARWARRGPPLGCPPSSAGWPRASCSAELDVVGLRLGPIVYKVEAAQRREEYWRDCGCGP